MSRSGGALRDIQKTAAKETTYVGRYSLNEKILRYDTVKINKLSFVRLKVFFLSFFMYYFEISSNAC